MAGRDVYDLFLTSVADEREEGVDCVDLLEEIDFKL